MFVYLYAVTIRMIDIGAGFSAQLQKGDRYGLHGRLLRPALHCPLIAIWVLERDFLPDRTWLQAFRKILSAFTEQEIARH